MEKSARDIGKNWDLGGWEMSRRELDALQYEYLKNIGLSSDVVVCLKKKPMFCFKCVKGCVLYPYIIDRIV